MARFSTRRKRRSLVVPEINLTPLIDTALTLLVIFMVTAPLVNNAIKINLPTGKAQESATTQQELVVYMDKEEKLFFNGNRVPNKDRLMKLIRESVGKQKERTVFVKADKSVHYGEVIELVDDIKVVGGVSYVALATKRA